MTGRINAIIKSKAPITSIHAAKLMQLLGFSICGQRAGASSSHDRPLFPQAVRASTNAHLGAFPHGTLGRSDCTCPVNRRVTVTAFYRMRRQTVHSENIVTVGYDRPSRVVEIEFSDGAIVRYTPVPVYVFRELLDSDSKGNFIETVLKPRFKSECAVRA
jgi:hypothetical protein